jgi:YidC/Oxa1 family membrane protein insertase
VLHVFHRVVGNYGLAIVMLTVLVRGLMFPLSRRQAASQAKMAELQPEIKKLNEKYKNDPAKRTQAQQQLFREHDYNPLGGCLLALIQLPIFVGLYSSLRGDVELRQAPLISENVRWASDLAAPDMLWNWSGVVPEFVSHGTGVLGLGPYFNLLPLATIALFIWQQKMFMPPPADEQAAMQQKMMQYMMIVVAIMFFKVPAGLGVYLITSSLWGIAERKLLGKSYATGAGASATAAVATSSSGNGAAGGRRRQKGRK